MTGKADFSAEEWELILEGPPGAGVVVLTAERGGMFRETFSIAKAYAVARQAGGESQLLDEIVATKPKIDKARQSNYEELKNHALAELRQAVALLDQKATPEEAASYRRFVIDLAQRVAEAHRKGDEQVTAAEETAVAAIRDAIGAGPSEPTG